MAPDPHQVTQVVEAVNNHLGSSITWTDYPGGWPGDIEAALIDAVYSARAVYQSKHGHGILALVERWRSRRERTTFDLVSLVQEIGSAGPEAWAIEFGNSQWSPSRPATAPGGPTKAATVLQAATCLIAAGIRKADDITDQTAPSVKSLLRSVPGIGYATTNYFLMLLGRPGVKPDRMVHRFLTDATGSRCSDAEAEELVAAAAEELDVEDHILDHAIWKYESDKAAKHSKT